VEAYAGSAEEEADASAKGSRAFEIMLEISL